MNQVADIRTPFLYSCLPKELEEHQYPMVEDGTAIMTVHILDDDEHIISSRNASPKEIVFFMTKPYWEVPQ